MTLPISTECDPNSAGSSKPHRALSRNRIEPLSPTRSDPSASAPRAIGSAFAISQSSHSGGPFLSADCPSSSVICKETIAACLMGCPRLVHQVSQGSLDFQHFPPTNNKQVNNSTGFGSFSAGTNKTHRVPPTVRFFLITLHRIPAIQYPSDSASSDSVRTLKSQCEP